MRSTVDGYNLRTVLLDSRPEVQAAIAAYVRHVATDYAEEVLSITLYGSQARGEASLKSDIDLFIVVRHDAPTLRQALADLAWRVQFEYDVVISDIIRSVEQLSRMQARRFPYYPEHRKRGDLVVEEHVRAYAQLRLEHAREGRMNHVTRFENREGRRRTGTSIRIGLPVHLDHPTTIRIDVP